MTFRRPVLITPEMNLKKFNSGKPLLDDWLKNQALQAMYGNTANTFVVQDDQDEVAGYYSIATGGVDRNEVTDRIRKGTGNYPIPVLLLARLAVDKRYQGRGIGAGLLKDVVIRGVEISTTAAFRAILTHPIDEDAANFYRKFGFVNSPVSPKQMMILLKDARKSFAV